jgi:hypothetical protein
MKYAIKMVKHPLKPKNDQMLKYVKDALKKFYSLNVYTNFVFT